MRLKTDRSDFDMKKEIILCELQEIAEAVLGQNDFVLTEKTKLSDLAVSSYGIVQMICAVEDRYDIEVPNKTLRAFKTVGDVVKYLEKNV